MVGVKRQATGDAILAFGDPRIPEHIAQADIILSSVPPVDGDPALMQYEAALATAPARWIGYLSSTGVYGDARGTWVGESSPVGTGRRSARIAADLAWQGLEARAPVHVFRLPGIYGPGRSALDRVRSGAAHRLRLEGPLAGHVFSRIHVEDIVTALIESIRRPDGGVYNLADDEPASGNAVIEYACHLLGVTPPPLDDFATAGLSPMARDFYSECRRVANGRMKRYLLPQLAYPTYREGLAAIWHEEQAR
ncbi:SDR family NAD(P)-dependent oxidoreductase [Hankyongella ginsenosidimutans]|uniref:SDR family NAD(P)-dependent oxidoreductase n=1 Tax=Hankyongella ginsenosidimutans TaxID=1763828 RepID=UPI001FECE74D|nr:SDR family NAD(P)-dependent oxidoreductase [Hankyongella ginsenosidimutans]